MAGSDGKLREAKSGAGAEEAGEKPPDPPPRRMTRSGQVPTPRTKVDWSACCVAGCCMFHDQLPAMWCHKLCAKNAGTRATGRATKRRALFADLAGPSPRRWHASGLAPSRRRRCRRRRAPATGMPSRPRSAARRTAGAASLSRVHRSGAKLEPLLGPVMAVKVAGLPGLWIELAPGASTGSSLGLHFTWNPPPLTSYSLSAA